MPRGINQVQLIGLAVVRLVVERNGLRLDGDAALALDRIVVQHLRLHLALFQATTDLDEAIRQRRFTVIDMGDDAEVTDVLLFHGNAAGYGDKMAAKYSGLAPLNP